MPRADVPGVRRLVEPEGSVLLIRNNYIPVKWDPPGGGVRRGERITVRFRRMSLPL